MKTLLTRPRQTKDQKQTKKAHERDAWQGWHVKFQTMGKKSDDEAIQVFLDWASDDTQVRKWQRDLNLRKLLGPRPRNFEKAAKGRDSDAMLVQIKGVLPQRIAEGAAAIVARIEDSKWNTLEGDGDPTRPALDGIRAAHRFGAVVDPSGIHGGQELLKALSRLMPPAENKHASFHLGRYEEGDFLAPQNDAAFCAVDAGSKDPARAGEIIKCSRDIGVMLFLSKNRKEAGGGLLRDLYYQHRADHKGAAYVPEFNSLIAFHVPREYEITPVLSDEPLLSVFGWYLQEGELYDLTRPIPTETDDDASDIKSKKSRKDKVKAAKRKLREKAKKEEKLGAIPDFLLALAAERESCRANKEFSRADAIRAQCLKAGYRFNAGGKLVKISETPANEVLNEAKSTSSENKKVQSDKKAEVRKMPAAAAAAAAASLAAAADDAAPKKKKESKAQRLQRQAKEAAAAASAGAGVEGDDDADRAETGGTEHEGGDEELGKRAAVNGGDSEADGKKRKLKGGDVEKDGGNAHIPDRGAEKGAKRKRSDGDEEAGTKKEVPEDQDAVEEEEGGEEEDAEDGHGSVLREGKKSKTKRGGKGGIARKMKKLLSLPTGMPAVAAGAGAGSQDAGGGGGGGDEGRGEAKVKKEPKRPKKSKMEKTGGAGGDAGAGGKGAQDRKGKARDILLARIKNKGWMRDAPVAAPSQM